MHDLAGIFVPMTLFVSIAAVAILRPLTKRLGDLLAAIAESKTTARTGDAEAARLRVALEQMGGRLELMEERLEFTERLLATSHAARPELPAPLPRERSIAS